MCTVGHLFQSCQTQPVYQRGCLGHHVLLIAYCIIFRTIPIYHCLIYKHQKNLWKLISPLLSVIESEIEQAFQGMKPFDLKAYCVHPS